MQHKSFRIYVILATLDINFPDHFGPVWHHPHAGIMRGFQKGITLVLFLKVGSPRKYSSSVSFFGEFLGVLEN